MVNDRDTITRAAIRVVIGDALACNCSRARLVKCRNVGCSAAQIAMTNEIAAYVLQDHTPEEIEAFGDYERRTVPGAFEPKERQ